MNNTKMLLEEILPFYFLLMLIVIMFTAHVPTTFELYIVYAFAFGVSMYNNRLYKANMMMHSWGEKQLELVDVLEEENDALIITVAELNDELEMMKRECSCTDIGNNSNDSIY